MTDEQARIAALERDLEDLRNVVLCLCLKVQPPLNLGRRIIHDEPGVALRDLGHMLQDQETTIAELARRLLNWELTAAGEPEFGKIPVKRIGANPLPPPSDDEIP